MESEWRRYWSLRQRLRVLAHRHAATGASDDWDDWLVKCPPKIEMPSEPVRLIVYLTKWSYLNQLRERYVEGEWPPPELSGVAWVGRYGLVSRGVAARVASLAERTGAPIAFLGDLDPFDLMTYLSLRAQLSRLRIEPRYGGIRGPFLEHCRSGFEKWGSPDAGCIELSSFETSTWHALKREPALDPSIIGEASAALLDRGLKIELEATMWMWAGARAEFASMLFA